MNKIQERTPLNLTQYFYSILYQVKWGRGIFDNVQRFLQFHLTVNAVALLGTLGGVLTAGAATNGKPPLNPVRHKIEYPVTSFFHIDSY